MELEESTCLTSGYSSKLQSSRQYGTGGFPGGAVVKNPSANAGEGRDLGSVSGSGRSPGGGNGNPLQYSCLKIPTGRGTWWATAHGVAKSRTRLSEHTVETCYFERGQRVGRIRF